MIPFLQIKMYGCGYINATKVSLEVILYTKKYLLNKWANKYVNSGYLQIPIFWVIVCFTDIQF